MSFSWGYYGASMKPTLTVPDKAAIELMPAFERLMLDRIVVVSTAAQADQAWASLSQSSVWGFDTESKPTFFKDQVSDGPHVLQLAIETKAWVIQLHAPDCRERVARWMADPRFVKAGFGLGDDRKRILHKLGVEPQSVIDLNHVFHQRGYRKDMGVKGAVAVLFGQRFAKSKKAATSNWAQPRLSASQVIYAANDAYAAWCVHQALGPFSSAS